MNQVNLMIKFFLSSFDYTPPPSGRALLSLLLLPDIGGEKLSNILSLAFLETFVYNHFKGTSS